MSESIATTLKKGNKLLYPTTYYNQVIMPDGNRWNGTAGSGVHIGPEAPEDDTTMWVDTDEEPMLVMPANAIKYKAFSIAPEAWTENDSIFEYSMEAVGVTDNTAIINLTLDANSQSYQKAQLDWETGVNYIKLSTAIKPLGVISGYLIATEVTVI